MSEYEKDTVVRVADAVLEGFEDTDGMIRDVKSDDILLALRDELAKTCDHCKGMGECPKYWGRAAITEFQARLDATRATLAQEKERTKSNLESYERQIRQLYSDSQATVARLEKRDDLLRYIESICYYGGVPVTVRKLLDVVARLTEERERLAVDLVDASAAIREADRLLTEAGVPEGYAEYKTWLALPTVVAALA